MNSSESERYLLSLGNEVSAMKLGLENISRLLAALGDPQNKYLKVQVAGTNGKGSVCAFLGAICNSAGIKTGVYKSPHLVSITERVQINGRDISEDKFAGYATRVRQVSEELAANGEIENIPTFFEQVTAIALLAFAEADVELAILETGLGGRLDATTAAKAEIAAITSVDIDHQEYLGETLTEIAAEKAAIIHPGSRVVIGPQKEGVMNVILEKCSANGITPLTFCEPSEWAIDQLKHSVVVQFRTDRDEYWDASLGLAGRHQIENACIAILVSETLRQDCGFAITHENIWRGLEDAKHPGRLEFQEQYLFDGAHNIAGAKALREFLDEFITQPITLIFGSMRGKDIGGMAEFIFPKAEKVILTQPHNSRAMDAAELAKCIPSMIDPAHVLQTATVEDAIAKAIDVTPGNGLILVTGSLYLVGEAKKILNN